MRFMSTIDAYYGFHIHISIEFNFVSNRDMTHTYRKILITMVFHINKIYLLTSIVKNKDTFGLDKSPVLCEKNY